MRTLRIIPSVAIALFTCIAAGQGLAEKPVLSFGGHAAEVTAIVFHREGGQIVSAGLKDVRVWNSDTGKETAGQNLLGSRTVALDHDGKRLAITHPELPRERNVVIRGVADGEELLTILPHGDLSKGFPFAPVIGGLAFSPDGERLATAGRTNAVGGPHGLPGGIVKIWDAKTGAELQRLAGPRPDVSTSTFAGVVAFSADGKLLAVGTDGAGGELPEAGEVVIWDVPSEKVRHKLPTRESVEPGEFFSSVSALALSRDGKWVAAAFGGRPARADGLILDEGPAFLIRIWDLSSGEAVRSLQGHKNSVTQIAFHPDSRRLASAGDDRVVRIWDTTTGEQIQALPFDTPRINAIAFSPDGKRLAAGGGGDNSGLVHVWSISADR